MEIEKYAKMKAVLAYKRKQKEKSPKNQVAFSVSKDEEIHRFARSALSSPGIIEDEALEESDKFIIGKFHKKIIY